MGAEEFERLVIERADDDPVRAPTKAHAAASMLMMVAMASTVSRGPLVEVAAGDRAGGDRVLVGGEG